MITSLTNPCNYEGIVNEETEQAHRLAECLKSMGVTKVLDVGCGPGNYVTEMRKIGIEADGVDIDPRCKETPHCKQLDVTQFKGEPPRYPIVISLEVGEHIPAHLSWNYVSYITNTKPDMVIFSAAIPGQGGDGHINLQYKSYWVHRFDVNGYQFDFLATEELRGYMASGYHLGWFIQNVMVFTPKHA